LNHITPRSGIPSDSFKVGNALGEDITETLEFVPRQWKVIQHVREKHSCRSCEKITQPPAPSHPIARGRVGPGLLAHVLFAKYRLHLPLNRQSATYAREGIELDVSTLGRLSRRFGGNTDATGRDGARPRIGPRGAACRRHHGVGARRWAHPHRATMHLCARRPAVRRRRSPPRRPTSTRPTGVLSVPRRIWRQGPGLMQADAYAGYDRLYAAGRRVGPIVEAGC